MHLDINSRVVDDPGGEMRQVWSNTDY